MTSEVRETVSSAASTFGRNSRARTADVVVGQDLAARAREERRKRARGRGARARSRVGEKKEEEEVEEQEEDSSLRVPSATIARQIYLRASCVHALRSRWSKCKRANVENTRDFSRPHNVRARGSRLCHSSACPFQMVISNKILSSSYSLHTLARGE